MAYTTIKKPSDYFNTKLYTGDGTSNQSITGVGFQPDFTWLKIMSDSHFHNLFDVIRGVNKALVSDDSGAEHTDDQYGWLSSFDSDGFTTQDGSNATHWSVNKSGDTYASWNWKANGAGSANTDGSISSTVSANTTSGFSIVSYTGTGANATVGHGLGVAPKMVIVKRLSNTENWTVYNKNIGATKYLNLDTSDAETTYNMWQDTDPTSSVFSITTHNRLNANGDTYIAYCFADVQGYSKFGSYTGGGSNFPFIYTGFKPAFVMWKKSSGAEDWGISDNKRDTSNVMGNKLRPNSNSAQSTANAHMDFLSNGFKWRSTSGEFNASGGSYIYMAFAEQPLVGDNPATAR